MENLFIFLGGIFFGACIGLFMAGLLGANRMREECEECQAEWRQAICSTLEGARFYEDFKKAGFRHN